MKPNKDQPKPAKVDPAEMDAYMTMALASSNETMREALALESLEPSKKNF